ncbi:MAG TPA: hypothetical protein VFX81_00955 [Burkholderiaceae bacterium]|nr:hypothetical protein [Burkholderiaceae bacterium]
MAISEPVDVSSGKKTTDLERLTQPGGRVLPDDETIPVLTERLTLPSLELDISLPPGPLPEPERAAAPGPAPLPREEAAPPAAASAVSTNVTAQPAPVAEVEWATVEEQARELLVLELQPRLAAELDRQLRERLQPTLVRMLLATVAELRPSIETAVRDAVARAVAAEVARQRSGK